MSRRELRSRHGLTLLHSTYCFLGLIVASAATLMAAESPHYTRLLPIQARVIGAANAFPGGSYEATNLVDQGEQARPVKEYASHGLREKTYVDFDLGSKVSIAAFRHIQRSTPDTIAESELQLSESADFTQITQRVPVSHVDEPGGVTVCTFPKVNTRFVRWQVTKVIPERSPNVGGRGIQFFATADTPETAPSAMSIDLESMPIIRRHGDQVAMPIRLTLDYPYVEQRVARLRMTGQTVRDIPLTFSRQTIELEHVTSAQQAESLKVSIEVDGKQVAAKSLEVDPARQLTVYILPHSHTDIGYTAIQTDIEEKQINNLLQGLAAARRTATYPEGARFVWNVEVVWAADLFLNRLPEANQQEFLEAVKNGQVALNGMYLNELTGLCRPEELVRLFRFATKLSDCTGTPLESAMISDVPGYTWGSVTAMNQAGIKYFSVAPNYFDRIGDILMQWENKPFWWVGPDGTGRVLVWIPYRGYAMSHIYRHLTPKFVTEFCNGLKSQQYPYDIAYMRWSGHGDNAVPDPSICEFVRDWNKEHVSPRFVISSTTEAFRAFEERYGDKLPAVRGDWTPYWEDGAGSSALETAINRGSAERVAQAETIWAMLAPARFPVAKFDAAWNQILLYSEHTWGAHCSITQPIIPFTTDQWAIKQSFAATANTQSRQLLSEAVQSNVPLEPTSHAESPKGAGSAEAIVDVYNTCSWPRTEVLLLSRELSHAGDRARDDRGEYVPTQRLANDELALLVTDLPPFSGRRYTITGDKVNPAKRGPLDISERTLRNEQLTVTVDSTTGAIADLRFRGLDTNLVDTDTGHGVNDYLYLIGSDISQLQRNGKPTISLRDRGPLVASLMIESPAPGCHKLTREVRLVAGGDYVELINTVDKQRLVVPSYMAAEGKESVNFAFPFRVPNGTVRLDVPLGVIRPEFDQIPSACKNWFTVGRWGDVANDDVGITWVTVDAPLVQVGGITATMLNSQTDPSVWRKHVEPTQRLYSWAMNNHWGTNYRAFQEGPVVFRYVVRPHLGRCRDDEAHRFATQFSQPLVAVPGRGSAPNGKSLLRVTPSEVVVSGTKPTDDGKGIIVRLQNLSDSVQEVSMEWADQPSPTLSLSDTSERALRPVDGRLTIGPRGFMAIRAELSNVE